MRLLAVVLMVLLLPVIGVASVYLLYLDNLLIGMVAVAVADTHAAVLHDVLAIATLVVVAVVTVDADRRGRRGVLWGLVTLFGPGLIGAMAWLIVRRARAEEVA